MKKLYCLILCLLMTWIGCNKDDLVKSDFLNKKDISNSSEYENALNTVKLFSEQNRQEKTKTSSSFEIKDVTMKKISVQFTHTINTKSLLSVENLPDTTSINLYTLVFEKNGQKGFSIVTGDERLKQVYAYTECGQLSDTLYNIGLAATLSQITYAVQNDLLHTYALRMTSAVNEERALSIGPLLHTKWHQNYPYNLQCPIMEPCKDNALAGCTAIAIAQVIAFLDVPRSRYQGTFDYSVINYSEEVPYAHKNRVAKFVRFIGDKVQTNYGCSFSGAKWKNFTPTLDLWGIHYEYANDANVDVSKLVRELVQGFPHITGGAQKKGEKGAHTWVWDGVNGKFKVTSDGRGPLNYQPIGTILFHCNWGWGGTSDGWYLQSNMEQPTDKTAPYLDNNTQLYITSIAPTRVENSTSNDNLPPF